MNPFLSSLHPIWKTPRHVFLEEDAIRTVAQKLSQEDMPVPSWRDSVFPPGDDETFVNFIGVGNAINFAYKDLYSKEAFSVEWKGRAWKGAYAMWACLCWALEQGRKILDARFLKTLSEDEAGEIFRGTTPMPMLKERCAILNEVGKVLDSRYGGKFSNLFDEAKYKAFGADGIVTRLIEEFISFRDESFHKISGTFLQFHKRAQLLAMMYQGRALDSTKLRLLSDYEDLGPIADYAVPRALRTVGILTYCPKLAEKIAHEVSIEKDSEEEQEIRAQTTQAQVKLLELINETRKPPITILNLDYRVWTMGRGGVEPHHLTKTAAY